MPPSLFRFPPPRPVPPIISAAIAVADGRLAMAINLRSHAFAGSSLRAPKASPPCQTLKDLALDDAQPNLRVLPFAKGRPLAVSLSKQAAASYAEPRPLWHLGWLTAEELRRYLGRCGVALGEVGLVYLGSKDLGPSYWAAEVPAPAAESGSPVMEGGGRSCFVELRTLMVATDWTDEPAMGELAVAGRVSVLLHQIVVVLFESSIPLMSCIETCFFFFLLFTMKENVIIKLEFVKRAHRSNIGFLVSMQNF